jgi:hypothetical protein
MDGNVISEVERGREKGREGARGLGYLSGALQPNMQ